MTQFAADTAVSVDRSRAEIERTLSRYGASAFAYGWDQDKALVGFTMRDRQIRFVVTLPDQGERKFTHTPTGQRRAPAGAQKEWEQAVKQRWRALLLIIKAKLEAVESGIVEFESEFLSQIVLPDGSTAGQWMQPQIEHAYEYGEMPAMLPALGSGT